MANIPEITLYPDKIGDLGSLSVTNAMISSFAVTILLILFALWIRKGSGVKPTRRQVMFEMMVSLIIDKMVMAFGDEQRARKLFPLIFSIFIFLIFANYFTLIPFIESIVTADGISIFSTPTAHYSQTIALGLLMVVTSHILAIKISPLRHLGNFIKIMPIINAKNGKERGMAVVDFFLGILDIVGEMAKLISVSTRLFGNMFAGGVIIAIVSGITIYTTYLVPIPFIVLGLLSGIVQAFVFSVLGILYISSLTNAVMPEEQPQTTN